MSWIQAILAILYLILYPFIRLIHFAWVLLQFLLAPFVHLALGVFHLAVLPLKVLLKFEAFFIFLAMALLTGVAAGLILHCTSTNIVEVLHLSSDESVLPRKMGRALKVKRPLRKQKRHLEEDPWSRGATIPLSPSDPASSGDYFTGWGSKKKSRSLSDGGLFSTTILEEDEYSQESGGY